MLSCGDGARKTLSGTRYTGALAHRSHEKLLTPTGRSRSLQTNAGRGARCVDWARRAQIADGVHGPRADASESKRRAECAAPCLSLHVKCLAGGLAFCVAAQGHAARRRLTERYQGTHLTTGLPNDRAEVLRRRG